MPERLRAAWPNMRAAFALFHVSAMLLLAFPAPEGGMNRGAWKQPTVQVELAAWAPRFGMAPAEFEERLYRFAVRYMGARDRIVAPFERYAAVTGCEQPWRMFIAPHRFPARFQLQARATGAAADAWSTLFEERSSDHRWHEAYFTQERVRSQLFRFSWPEFAGAARRHCDWLARQVFAEDTGTEAVRCRFYSAESPTPEQVLAGDEPAGHFGPERVVIRPGTVR